MTGKHLSHYLIESELGRGGMGIVYRARDTKLDRTVAIKVLPSAALASDDDRTRFYREAKAAAALTHPHIAVIHGVDEAVPEGAPHGTEPSPFIAMEFIEGQSLAARIEEGPLKLSDAVRIASEIASGLEAAHKKDIVHRDIKAANVMLDENGAAKILDFGLAQTAASTKLTRMGSTLGTVAYMSPEQTRGEPVDRRTDIWSLGAVLYEMVAGRAPFQGDYEQALVYGILNEDPEPLTALRTGVPMGLEWIVSKCLAKKPGDRYQTATDLMVDLRTVDLTATGVMSRASSSPAFKSAQAGKGAVTSRSLPWMAGLVIFGVLVGGAVVYALSSDEEPEPPPIVRATVTIDGVRDVGDIKQFPDRRRVVFRGTEAISGEQMLFLYDLSTTDLKPIPGTRRGEIPSVSPNGNSISFDRDGQIWVMEVAGSFSSPTAVADGISAYWLEDGNIYIETVGGELDRYSPATGITDTVVVPDSGAGETGIWTPMLSPDEEHLFVRPVGADVFEEQLIRVVDLESGSSIPLSVRGQPVAYLPSGHLLSYAVEDVLEMKVSEFNMKTREVVGTPRPVRLEAGENTLLTLLRDGSLWSKRSTATSNFEVLLVETSEGSTVENNLFSMDRSGTQGSVTARPSHSGRHVAANSSVGSRLTSFVILDLETTNTQDVPFDHPVFGATWSRDDSRLAFTRFLGLRTRLYIYDVHSGAAPDSLDIPGLAQYFIVDWFPGEEKILLIGNETPFEEFDLYSWSLENQSLEKLFDTELSVRAGVLSPDGRYVAVGMSGEGSAGRQEIFDLQTQETIPKPVTDAVDFEWKSDGSALFFRRLGDPRIYEQRISLTPRLQWLGEPAVAYTSERAITAYYPVGNDGKFLIGLQDDELDPGNSFEVAFNWALHVDQYFEDR